jgi:hypothetical protein
MDNNFKTMYSAGAALTAVYFFGVKVMIISAKFSTLIHSWHKYKCHGLYSRY